MYYYILQIKCHQMNSLIKLIYMDQNSLTTIVQQLKSWCYTHIHIYTNQRIVRQLTSHNQQTKQIKELKENPYTVGILARQRRGSELHTFSLTSAGLIPITSSLTLRKTLLIKSLILCKTHNHVSNKQQTSIISSIKYQ